MARFVHGALCAGCSEGDSRVPAGTSPRLCPLANDDVAYITGQTVKWIAA